MQRLTVCLLLVAGGCSAGRPDTPGQSGSAHTTNTVEADDAGRDLRRVEDMLRGQIAGVEVRQGPRGLVVRIRQAGGFMTSADPLFVVDGLPIEAGADGALDGLNPRDVASIRVLKSVSETALYGSRGANGVVLITTVRPPAASTVVPDGK